MQLVLLQIFQPRHEIPSDILVQIGASLVQFDDFLVITVGFNDIIGNIAYNGIDVHVDGVILGDVVAVEGEEFLEVAHSFVLLLLFLVAWHLKLN